MDNDFHSTQVWFLTNLHHSITPYSLLLPSHTTGLPATSSRRRLSWEQMHTNVEDGDLAYLSLAQSVIRMSLDCSLKFAYLNTIARVCTSSCLVVAYRKTSIMKAVLVHDWHQDHGLTYLEQLWKYMDSNKNESVSYDSRVRRSFLTVSHLIACIYVTVKD